MTTQVTPDVEIVRREVQHKYTEVATTPDQTFHFHHLADIVVHKQVPDGAKANVDLWTA
jgi:hypothetical protein